ncbi:MAG: M28 family metallopeptidase [Chloroflexota bacterium]
MQPDPNEVYTQDALGHIRHLAQAIGGRGSCTEAERRAARYAADQMEFALVKNVTVEPFQAVPSTYWGYALSFAIALTGSLLVGLAGGRDAALLAVALNLLGMWGMLAETETRPSWVRLALPRAASQNVSGVIAPAGEVRRRVALCAHLDTHRTPVFYSSETWYTLFSLLVGLAFLSMLGGALVYGLGALYAWAWLPFAALGCGLVQAAALGLCLQADLTPYSPGANDNASGVGAVLALARRLEGQPLQHTEVHLALTGCEEVGDYGMAAYLDRHAAALGPQALYIVLDEIGLGPAKYLTRDGLLLKHATHPAALAAARQVKAQHPQLRLSEGPGLAYTDALVATLRGLPALTVCTVPEPGSGVESHWHRMTDTPETIDPADLANAMQFTWLLLQAVDQAGA